MPELLLGCSISLWDYFLQIFLKNPDFKFDRTLFKLVMYSLRLRLRLSKIRHIKIICLKAKTKSDKWDFDYEIKTKNKRNEISFYKSKTKIREIEL